MTISAFDLFKVGIGPSSSHTVAPMRAARSFAARLEQEGLLASTTRVRAELFGSLGATGHGHGSVGAVALGLEGEQPDVVDPAAGQARVLAIRDEDALLLMGKQRITFRIDDDIVLHRRKRLPLHPNGMLFRAAGVDGSALLTRTYYSVGGGFVLSQDEAGNPALAEDPTPVRYPFRTGAELLARTRETGLSISEIMLANELAWRSAEQVHSGLLHIWSVMQDCVRRGSHATGVLPGGLKVRRRAAALRESLEANSDSRDALRAMEWVTLYALAVNEENAAGGRVVTALFRGSESVSECAPEPVIRVPAEAFLLTVHNGGL